MRTAVVILNWNTKTYLERFLPSLLKSLEGKDAELVVADNASSDGSLEWLKGQYPEVRSISLSENFGFTGGYNRALAQLSGYEYYLLINSDIEVEGDWLTPLVEWMDEHPKCGACGPKLHKLCFDGKEYYKSDEFEYAGAAGGYVDRLGFPYCRGRVLKWTALDKAQFKEKQLMWVSGACLLTRAALWKELGGFDDRFFAHMEEIDYCWRLQEAGYQVYALPFSCVWHLGGGTLPSSSAFKLKLNFRNNLLLLDKHLPLLLGERKAKRRLAARQFLDCGIAILYLLSGKIEAYKAVHQAHKEFKELRCEACGAKREVQGEIAGYSDELIILKALLLGKKILRKDEDNN